MITLHEDQYIFLIISRSTLIRIRNFRTKIVEKAITQISLSVAFFSPRKSCLYEIMWKNIVEGSRPQMTI
jgi:hypothetical protein